VSELGGAGKTATPLHRLPSLPLLSCIVLATLLARAPLLGHPMIYPDEQFYLLVGDRLLQGALPYIDIWDRKPAGLFLVFAGARLLGGDGIVQYQLVAMAFSLFTSILIYAIARQYGADRRSAAGGAAAYPLLMACFQGGGGQSPVFYNPFMAAAFLLVVSAPAGTGKARARGVAAMLLVGIAMQIKYTAIFEGVLFGILLLWRRFGKVSAPALSLDLLLWIGAALLPSFLAASYYWSLGHLDAFWHANFTSTFARAASDAGFDWPKALLLLALLAPVLLVLGMIWRSGREDPLRKTRYQILMIWSAVALLAILIMGGFSRHYAQPIMVPAAIAIALALDEARNARRFASAIIVLAAVGALAAAVEIRLSNGSRRVADTLAAAMATSPNCPYVFDGPVIGYLLAGSCLPSKFVFPTHLRWRSEAAALGTDQVGELRRVLSNRPGIIVKRAKPGSGDSPEALRTVGSALARDYLLVQHLPTRGNTIQIYRRRDLPALPLSNAGSR
jgi:4-amino-4-deoxy-L-arabinose transferase-like glycosyltransferase